MTSRRNRKGPQVRGHQRSRLANDNDMVPMRPRNAGRSASASAASGYQIDPTFDPLANDPLNSYHSNRYPGVDTNHLVATSRANSLTANDIRFIPRAPMMSNRTATGIDVHNAPAFNPNSRNLPLRQNSSFDGTSMPPRIAYKDSTRSVTGSASASGLSANGTSGKSSSNSSFERANNVI